MKLRDYIYHSTAVVHSYVKVMDVNAQINSIIIRQLTWIMELWMWLMRKFVFANEIRCTFFSNKSSPIIPKLFILYVKSENICSKWQRRQSQWTVKTHAGVTTIYLIQYNLTFHNISKPTPLIIVLMTCKKDSSLPKWQRENVDKIIFTHLKYSYVTPYNKT